jgi:hypothetical protein
MHTCIYFLTSTGVIMKNDETNLNKLKKMVENPLLIGIFLVFFELVASDIYQLLKHLLFGN